MTCSHINELLLCVYGDKHLSFKFSVSFVRHVWISSVVQTTIDQKWTLSVAILCLQTSLFLNKTVSTCAVTMKGVSLYL